MDGSGSLVAACLAGLAAILCQKAFLLSFHLSSSSHSTLARFLSLPRCVSAVTTRMEGTESLRCEHLSCGRRTRLCPQQTLSVTTSNGL